MNCDGTQGLHPAPHEPVEMHDEGVEWVERFSDEAREIEWHVYRCPRCGYVTEAI